MWILLERLSEVRESLDVWWMREFIVDVRGDGGIRLPLILKASPAVSQRTISFDPRNQSLVYCTNHCSGSQ